MIAGMDSLELTGTARPVETTADTAKFCRTMSVLVATKRPEMMAFWPQLLAVQDYPDFEVIAALHGDAFTAADVATARSWLGERLTVLRVPGECGLGEVLNRATAAATGELVVKWDDDDLYSSRHLSDLATAHRESGATVVGKMLEYVYLASSNRTIRLETPAAGTQRICLGSPSPPPPAYLGSPSPPPAGYLGSPAPPPEGFLGKSAAIFSGNTLCLAREDLQQVGGWREVPRAVDTRLLQDVLQQGGQLYRASGAGFLLMRNSRAGHQHTWQITDEDLLRICDEQRPGADAGFAMVDVPEALLEQWSGAQAVAV